MSANPTSAGSAARHPSLPYSALFYPAASGSVGGSAAGAACWDLTGGCVGDPTAAAAAAAAAAATLLEPRHRHQHQQHPQHAQLHQLHHQRQPPPVSRNPFDPQSRIPLPHPFGEFHFGCESSFIRRRNERERERVRFVNEGYERLKESLPFENKDKRISKVEILKTAIRYIQHMEGLLRAADQQQHQQHQPSALGRKPADVGGSSGLKRRALNAPQVTESSVQSPEKRLRHS